jgi:shikimate dehydrogenase
MNWAEVPMISNPFAENLGRPPFIRLGIIGDPVDHSLSPVMHQAALNACGVEGEYLAIHVPPDELVPALENLKYRNFRGLNVTVPHKQSEKLIRAGDKTVRAIGAANTVLFGAPVSDFAFGIIHSSSVIGSEVHTTNTDAEGFYSPLNSLPVGRALLLGAGGAANSAAHALCSHGWALSVWNRTSDKAAELANRFAGEVRDEPDPAECSIVINATTLGLNVGEEPPLVWNHLERDATVYDLVYRRGATDFLAHALLEGASIIDGREMLVAQGALSFRWWLGLDPPIDVMRKAVGL